METAASEIAPRGGSAGKNWSTYGLGALLAAIVLAAYSNTFHVPFLLDDASAIHHNASIQRLWPLGPVLSPPSDSGTGGRPVANLSFALNYVLGGLGVTGYHVTNLAIHAAAGLVLFGLVRRTRLLPLVRSKWCDPDVTLSAFSIAALWLLHPIQTEAVTYISQRTESLMGLFYLLTLYGFVRAATDRSRFWGIITILCCGFGMATKEVMVTAPVLVLLYDRTFIAGTFGQAWRERKRLHLCLAATWILLLFLLLDVQERGVGYATVSAVEYALIESRAILHYARLALWPTPLVFDYGPQVSAGWHDVWLHLIILTLLLAATALALWKKPVLGFLGAWFFVILAPASSVVPVAGQPVAEHRMYLSLLAVVVLFTLGVHWLLGRHYIAAILGLALVAAGATFARNRDYAYALTLWKDTVAKAPQNARAHASLGAAWLEAGSIPDAIPALERALALDPHLAEAHNNLATALLDVNRVPEAVAHFAAALEIRPGSASTHYNFGNALLSLGRTAEAIAQQQQALILRADFPEARCALADALAASGRLDEAIASYRAALARRPTLLAAHHGLANSLVRAGRPAEAIPHFEATLRAMPESAEAHYNFGNLLLGIGQHADAVGAYATAVRVKPDFAEAHHNLANALELSGRSEQAIQHYEVALRLRPDFPRTNLDALRAKSATRPR